MYAAGREGDAPDVLSELNRKGIPYKAIYGFNLYGVVPDAQVMREWLGTSYEEKIPEYLNQMFAA